ncbi:hypothetical protein NUKP76_56240 [Klebsiella variicola]|uniref:hypothetical protein n=1 Tax=Klebsiella variicola TaxID=244366 RepID=UPI0021817E0B|nr:hypothetical protein [Klebsiella variicola]GKN12272.1 hypothetical protein NUKP76_56240 [Klebsiella variicola]HCI9104749.1 hypothetical protein [Klebsiella variicola]
MTITLQAVNELIASLESAGEPSIREQKFLKLAKAYQQLAAENVEAKKIISECREYFIAGVMNRIRPTNEGYLHMICDTFADETPATDRIVAGIKADGVEEFAAYQRAITEEWACKEGHSSLLKVAESAEIFAKQLRERADK